MSPFERALAIAAAPVGLAWVTSPIWFSLPLFYGAH